MLSVLEMEWINVMWRQQFTITMHYKVRESLSWSFSRQRVNKNPSGPTPLFHKCENWGPEMLRAEISWQTHSIWEQYCLAQESKSQSSMCIILSLKAAIKWYLRTHAQPLSGEGACSNFVSLALQWPSGLPPQHHRRYLSIVLTSINMLEIQTHGIPLGGSVR